MSPSNQRDLNRRILIEATAMAARLDRDLYLTDDEVDEWAEAWLNIVHELQSP